MKKSRFSINMPAGYSKTIHAVLLLLSVFGAIMVTSASMYNESSRTLGVLIGKELAFIIISYMMMVFFARTFNWSWFKKGSLTLSLIILAAIVLLVLPRFYTSTKGSYNWIRFPGFTLQPSELLKPFLMAIVSMALGTIPLKHLMLDPKKVKQVRFPEKMKHVWSHIAVPFVSVMVMLGIVFLIQIDFGTFMILFLLCVILFFTATHPYLTTLQRILFVVMVVFIGLGVYAMTPSGLHLFEMVGIKGYQLNRITALYTLFERDRALSETMQQVNGLLAFAKGGLFGNGLGTSILKYGYIPEQDSDYVLAILIDEFGFLGFLLISIGYMIIMFILFKYAFKIRHQPSRLFLIGTASYIFIHYLFNVGGTSGLIPLTGVPLLLISAGGSSQMAVFISIGISQNIIARFVTGQKKKRKT